ncbi:MAG TPA: aminopeptidase [Saprospiraceae bacterium]|nr:aminopeptidase [Saprospiraceae bacterium]HND89181.1 aminopeptidase [Saprospiraceae bacterium]
MSIAQRYARLLTEYCLAVRPGDKVYISSTLLAEPLVREVYRAAYAAGAALVECDWAFRERDLIMLQEASDEALATPPTLTRLAMEHFDCYLNIRAPYNLREAANAPAERQQLRQQALAPINKTYFERTADRRLRRNLCQWPTDASAQEAGMSLSEYEAFVFGACKLLHDDPKSAWLNVRAQQQHIVDHLNACSSVRYRNEGTDITFSTQGRIWMNSDGQTNMPSGEVYTSPVEDSAQGVVHFSYPCLYQGHEVEGVTLWVKDGLIERWEARRGQDFLDHIFQQPGTRRFGEAAIGTNYDIDRMTKNILFDEKIGGTIHMAIGQSYLQTGGKNESPVHWDMITDMTQGGEIWADGEKIYQNGRFLI